MEELPMPLPPARYAAPLRALAGVAVLVAFTGCGGDSPTAPSGGGRPPLPPTGGVATIVAVADIGWCGLDGARLTGQLIQGTSGSVLIAGDIAYPSGRPLDFQNCFDPFYGPFKSRLRPVPGNHEYDTPGAAGYFQYFGEAARPGGLSYYTMTEGDWFVLMLDSNIPAGPGSAQYEFVRAALQARRGGCAMAVFHHPLFSSARNGPSPFMREMFRLLYDNGVEVVVSGHDHAYERFGPQDADGRPDAVRGVRQFIAGTGGAQLYPFVATSPNSEARISAWGILRMTLRAGAYEWSFLGTDNVVGDSGFSICH
jgi:hypothetical protein